ncbi:MAG: hypothetical protein HQ497_02695 [SAR86 cluster bacterium]|uniref:Uncharacterized protein n=1 Tax=SAR86 cluster bacterium TaxID=2030880 RepID=A0A972VU17_9GAMM|nr:hypothetical protein [SAR86 cluster bacterium]
MNINFQYRVEQELSERLSPAGRLHSQLAMRAAKGMAVTRQKSRHGRVVCHHLLRMLSSEGGRNGKMVSDFQLTAPVTAADYAIRATAGPEGLARNVPPVSAQVQQYSLGF